MVELIWIISCINLRKFLHMLSHYDVTLKQLQCVRHLRVSVVKLVQYTALTTRADSSGQVSQVKWAGEVPSCLSAHALLYSCIQESLSLPLN